MISIDSKVKISAGRWVGQQGIVREISDQGDSYKKLYKVDLSNGRATDIILKENEIEELYPVENDDPRVLNLKERARDPRSWRDRIEAIKELQYYDCQRAKDVLAKIVKDDPVYKVREEAYKACKVLRVKRGGGLIELKKRPPRCIYDKGIMNKLRHVHNVLMNGSEEGYEYTLEEFKNKFKELHPIEYDVYEGYEEKFDKWLKLRIKDIHEGKTKYIRRLHIKGKKCC